MWKNGSMVRMWLFVLMLSIGWYCDMFVMRLWCVSIIFFGCFVVLEE